MKIRKIGTILALLITLFATIGSRYHLKRISEMESLSVSIEELPMDLGEWKGKDTQGLDIRSQEILKLTNYVKRQYVKDGASIILYIGYWETQTGDYQAAKHSPALCLPSNGWTIDRKPAIDVGLGDVASESVRAKRIVGDYRGSTQLFYYWFFTGERDYAEEWQALINISLSKFFTGRSDGGIVEISTALPTGMNKAASEEKAAEILEDFMKELYPALSSLVEQSKLAS